MVDPGPRITLIDPSFRPADRQGKFEVALALWTELLLDRFQRLCQWFAARPLTTFVLWTLWLSGFYFCLGPASYVKVPDCGNGTLPARMVSANDFLHGRLGNWMDFSGCGTDRVLNNFRLEPHCILLALLPGWLGYGLIAFGQRFVAGYFLYRVTRDDLGFKPEIAILTGMSYALFHQIGIHWQWDGFTLYDGFGIPGLPLLFWLTNRLTPRPLWQSLPGGVLMGASLALSAPYFQTLFFPFLAVFWYTFIQKAWSGRRFTFLTCVFIGWAIVTAPEMYAAAKYVPLSHRQEIVVRSDSPYVKYIENVQHWPRTVWQSNKLYLIMAGLGLAFSRLRDRRVVITVLAIWGILSFVSHYHYFNDNMLSKLGILSSFHFHRFIYLVPFLCSLAMGLGLMALPTDTVLSASNRITALRFNVYDVALLVASFGMVYVSTDVNLDRWKQMWRGESFQLLYRHPDLLALAARKETEPEFRVACVTDMWRPGLGMSDSHRWSVNPGICWAYGLETTDGYQVLYSLRYKQFWSEVLLPLMSRDELRARQHIHWGNMLFLWHPVKEETMDRPFDQYFNLNLLSLANTKYIVSPVPLEHPDLWLLPSKDRENLLKWDDRHSTKRALGALKGEWAYRPLYIYENRRALPRFFLARHVTQYDDPNTLVHDLRSRQPEWLRDHVHVNQEDLPADVDLSGLEDDRYTTCSDSAGEVTVISRTSDRLELEFDANQPCVLFLSHSFSPYWRATLDGQAVSIFPANHAFQGVHVPTKGKHRVVFTYTPPYALFSAQ
jgi:hypothetical protein